MIKEILITEFLTLRKRPSSYLFILYSIISLSIFAFTAHIFHIGRSANENFPLNVTYSGYVFARAFFFLCTIICIHISTSVRDDINSTRTYFLFTQNATRFDYFYGKTIFAFLLSVCLLALFSFISWICAFQIFSGQLPILTDGKNISISALFFNHIINFLFLLPVMIFFYILAFAAGFTFKKTLSGILFLVPFLLVLFIIIQIDKLIPATNMIMYNYAQSNFNLITSVYILYLFTCICLVVIGFGYVRIFFAKKDL